MQVCTLGGEAETTNLRMEGFAIIAALKDAFAYCDRAHDSMTDAAGTQTVKVFGGDMPKFGVLTVNNLHSVEHYGNLVVYLRMNGIVPPSSDPEFMKQMYSK